MTVKLSALRTNRWKNLAKFWQFRIDHSFKGRFVKGNGNTIFKIMIHSIWLLLWKIIQKILETVNFF